jgi:HK97 family phage prohead protease
MSKREVRTVPAEVALRSDGEGFHLEAYAAVFDKRSDNLGGFYEIVAPGAFARTLDERGDAKKLFHNHDTNIVLASTRGGTLKLAEDTTGLSVDASLPDNEWGRPVRDAIERKDVDGMSFGFALASKLPETSPQNTSVSWEGTPYGGGTRTLHEVKLYEVSTVSEWPAYPDTTVGVRALAQAIGAEEAELEGLIARVANGDELTEQEYEIFQRIAHRAKGPDVTPYLNPNVAKMLARRAEREAAWTAGLPAGDTESEASAPADTDGQASETA